MIAPIVFGHNSLWLQYSLATGQCQLGKVKTRSINCLVKEPIFSSKPKSACLVKIVHIERQIVVVPDTHQKEKQFWHVLKKCPGSAHFGAFFRSLLSFRGGWFFTLPHQRTLFGPDILLPMSQLKNTNHWNVIIFLEDTFQTARPNNLYFVVSFLGNKLLVSLL